MTGAITFEFVAAVIAIVVFVFAVWLRVEHRIRRGEDALAASLKSLSDEFVRHKIEVAQKYVTISHLKDVEERLIQEVRRLGDRIDKAVSETRK